MQVLSSKRTFELLLLKETPKMCNSNKLVLFQSTVFCYSDNLKKYK